jgi:hypothetical protein
MQLRMHQALFSNLMLSPKAREVIFNDENYVEVDEQWLRAARSKDGQDQQTSELNHSNDDRTHNGQRPIHNNQSA